MSVLVVGSVAYDTVESPFGSADAVLGGSATYFSLAACHFTTPRVVAVVGEDFRQEHLDLLRSKGVDVEGLTVEPGDTFRWGGRYEADGINRTTLFTHLNVFETFSPVLPPAYRDTKTVFLANIGPELQLRVLEQVDAPSFVAADTMDLWIQTQSDALREVIRRVDLLLVNDAEATALTGERLMPRAADAILAMGPKAVVIKRGEHGAMLFTEDGPFVTPAIPLRRVFDPTGAGDSFAGGFLGYLAAGGPVTTERLREAMVVATVMASFTVETFSIERLARATLAEARERATYLRDITRFDVPPLGDE